VFLTSNQNEKQKKKGSQFSMKDVEVVTAVVDLEAVRTYRGISSSRGVQAAQIEKV
jgi:NAD+ synthase (glutamine-hydrolysing)